MKKCVLSWCKGTIDKNGDCNGYDKLMKRKCTYEDYETKTQIKVEALGQSKRQEFLDLMWSGLNVGDASKKMEIESMVGARIIVNNIKSYQYISKKAN